MAGEAGDTPDLKVWILGQSEPAVYTLRFEARSGRVSLRMSRPGVVIDLPPRTAGQEANLSAGQIRSTRLLHFWDSGRKKRYLSLSRLSDAQLSRLPAGRWLLLEPISAADGDFLSLRDADLFVAPPAVSAAPVSPVIGHSSAHVDEDDLPDFVDEDEEEFSTVARISTRNEPAGDVEVFDEGAYPEAEEEETSPTILRIDEPASMVRVKPSAIVDAVVAMPTIEPIPVASINPLDHPRVPSLVRYLRRKAERAEQRARQAEDQLRKLQGAGT